jgi:hypothetical protein
VTQIGHLVFLCIMHAILQPNFKMEAWQYL